MSNGVQKDIQTSNTDEIDIKHTEQALNTEIIKTKKSKKNILVFSLITILLILVGIAAVMAFFIHAATPVPTDKPIESKVTPPPSLSRVISFSSESEVKLLNLTTEKTEVIDTAVIPSGVHNCLMCARNTDVSYDSKRVAMDYMGDGTSPSVGYYDRLSRKKIIIGPGYAPRWNTDGSALAYYDDEGIKVYTLSTQKITSIQDSGRTIDSSGVEGLPPLIYGWNTPENLVFDDRKDGDDLAYSIVNLSTDSKTRTEYSVKTLSVDQSLRSGALSPDGTQILASVDFDPGYDTGVFSIEGLRYKSISGNTSPRWPGSGFFIAGWSDDNKSVVIRNQFYSASVQSNDSSKEKYEVRDLEGENSYVIDTDRAQAPIGSDRQPSACWIGNKIYLNFIDKNDASYLGMFDTKTRQVTNVYTFPSTALSGLGCPTAN